MTGNIETRLRKLEAEQELGAPQIIILKRNEGEDLEAILDANNVKRGPHDLIISLCRGLTGEVPFLSLSERIVSIQQTARRAA